MLRAVGFLTVAVLFAGSAPADVPGQAAADAAADAAVLLRVEGDVPRPLKLTAAEFARLPRRSVKARDHAGKESVFEGVALVDVVKPSGVPLGADLKGPALALYLVVEAADGYRAVFALPEVDPASTDALVLLADRRDGQPLDAKEGPLRVVVPAEKRQARWVRQVVVLRIKRS